MRSFSFVPLLLALSGCSACDKHQDIAPPTSTKSSKLAPGGERKLAVDPPNKGFAVKKVQPQDQ